MTVYRALSRPFFARPVEKLAPLLLGKILISESRAGRRAGLIVETEAYAQTEPACHAYGGLTERNRSMFGPAGHLYVYQSYGIHWCANVVAGRRGFGAAVLLRALEPLEGIALMLRGRGQEDGPRSRRDLARGPGRLCAALDIGGHHDGADLTQPPLWIAAPAVPRAFRVRKTGRIGISRAKQRPWRFCMAGNPHVSGPARLR